MKTALFFLIALTLSCQAQAYSASELREDCLAAESLFAQKHSPDPYLSIKGARCIGYVAGFADGYAVSDFLADKIGIKLNAFCLPQESGDLSYRMVRAVLAQLDRLPPNTAASPPSLVATALSKTFPCSETGESSK